MSMENEKLYDLTEVRTEEFFDIDKVSNKEAYMKYKESTPARLGIGRCGARYKTETLLRFRADHAIAQDAVNSHVSEEFIQEKGWASLSTIVKDKEEYLTRPDYGRILNEESIEAIQSICEYQPKVLVYVSDGLSATAIETNAYDTLKAIELGLKADGIELATPFFVKYGRVAVMDQVSEILDAEVTAVLIGERPGLATGESMSCYMIYKGRVGNVESRRTVVSNIHKNGTPAVEAGAHIAEIIKKMLVEKKSGVEFKL